MHILDILLLYTVSHQKELVGRSWLTEQVVHELFSELIHREERARAY